MCGIAGILARNINDISSQTVLGIQKSIFYRGQDEQQTWSDQENILFSHSRLSIIDLQSGSQPMVDISSRYTIIFNGEIYNYTELRAEYEKKGAIFRTKSDTEVILEGFKLKGKEVCRDLNGMFAFAIWDSLNKILFLARDRLGKKPLFWYRKNNIFYFSSTIDSFRHSPDWSENFSFEALSIFSTFSGYPGSSTIFNNVYQIPSATSCFIDVDKMEPVFSSYWHLDFSHKNKKSLNDILDEYEDILTNAISIRLRSDVPLAITFSGGVDSGTIAAICSQKLNISLKCYTVDYHTQEDPSEETIIAKKTARHLGLDWEYIHFDYSNDLLKELPLSYKYYDQPVTQIAIVYSRRLYEAIKPHATVVLSGNGGDELFTGYNGDEVSYKKDIRSNPYRWLFPAMDRTIPLLPYKYFSSIVSRLYAFSYEPWRIGQHPDTNGMSLFDRTVYELRKNASDSGVKTWLDWTMLGHLTYSNTDANYRLPDITGLAAQIEVRSPFLDYRLIEFAAKLPGKYKVGDPDSPRLNKYLPKLYYQRKVPTDIAWASKKGMGMNIQFRKNIMHDPTYYDAFDFAFKYLDQAGIDTVKYRKAWMEYRKGDRSYANTLMTGFMFQKWLERDLTNTP